MSWTFPLEPVLVVIVSRCGSGVLWGVFWAELDVFMVWEGDGLDVLVSGRLFFLRRRGEG